MLLTDIIKIRYYGGKRFKKNVEFRAFLKSHELSDEDLDAIVQELHNEVASAISCTSCSNCCKELKPEFTPRDIKRISAFLGISVKDFKNQYLKKEDGEMYLNRYPCPFLADTKCRIYDIRPQICRTYPNLLKKEFRSRLLQVIDNYSVCPIVFNVVERLKERLQFTGFDFHNVIGMR